MNLFINLLQEVNIEEKIKTAPNNAYEIGVFIGSMLPFTALVAMAYLIYYFISVR
ncbi:hypothetical protein [Pseudotamlana carrageenivorans]|uniref:hypothetical protein n=1 Tax=Pseudotamlana carrageenivorans TaxID=2069432 RepID=UPI0018F05386|nr:hypothetical protein [Tamlana carrageenivorans]